MSWRSEADGHPALSGLSPAGLVLVTLMECLFFNSLNLVICFWLCWSSLLHRFFSSCGVQASRCGGFSCCRAWALGHADFDSRGSWAVEHSHVDLLCGMWHLPGPGVKLMSPALAGRFLTAEPPVVHQGNPPQSLNCVRYLLPYQSHLPPLPWNLALGVFPILLCPPSQAETMLIRAV